MTKTEAPIASCNQKTKGPLGLHVFSWGGGWWADCYLEGEEGESDDEVGTPVDTHGDGGGEGSSALAKELRDEEPRNRAWPHGKHDHEENDPGHAEVRDPRRRLRRVLHTQNKRNINIQSPHSLLRQEVGDEMGALRRRGGRRRGRRR